jgi:hypothetical protein
MSIYLVGESRQQRLLDRCFRDLQVSKPCLGHIGRCRSSSALAVSKDPVRGARRASHHRRAPPSLPSCGERIALARVLTTWSTQQRRRSRSSRRSLRLARLQSSPSALSTSRPGVSETGFSPSSSWHGSWATSQPDGERCSRCHLRCGAVRCVRFDRPLVLAARDLRRHPISRKLGRGCF